MTVCEDSRSTGTIVIVDCTKEHLSQLPRPIKKAFTDRGEYWPKVVITDAAMSRVFGSYSYQQLKPKDFRSLFRDAKRDFKEASNAGELPELVEAEEDKETSKSETSNRNESAESSFEPSEFQQWTSAQGNKIDARLVAMDDNNHYVFETRDKKKIKILLVQLSEESQAKAREVTGE